MQIAVLGLGNLMRTDDAAGMLALEKLRQEEKSPGDVRWIEGGTLGLDLLDALRGVTHLLALDAVDAGATAGSILRFANDELSTLPVSKSVHLLGFADLMNVLQLLGDAPEQVVLLGVQPAVIDWGTSLTPMVQAAQPVLLRAALEQIARWQAEGYGTSEREALAAGSV